MSDHCDSPKSTTESESVTFGGAPEATGDAKAALLAAALEYARRAGLGKGRGLAAFCARYNERTLPLGAYGLAHTVYEHVGRVGPSTLRRWELLQRGRGATALDPAYGHTGRQYASHWDRHPKQAELALALFCEHGPSVRAAFVAERIHDRFPDRAARGEVPGIRAVQRFRQAFRRREPQLCDYLENPDAWKGKHLTAVGSKSEGVTRLNEVWEVDSTSGDILLQDRRADGTVRLKRHNLLAVIEVYSRMVRVLVVPSETSGAAMLVLRQAILGWRRYPERVRMDLGPAYRSRAYAGALRRIGVAAEPLPPGSPEEKPFVERFFSTLTGELLQTLPGYCGRNVKERRALQARAAARLGPPGPGPRRIRRVIETEVALSREELQAACDAFTERYVYERHHEGIGCTPAERVAEWNALGVAVRGVPEEQYAEHEAALLGLLPAVPGTAGRPDGVRSVRKGRFNVNNLLYYAAGLGEAETGQEVLVRCDPVDPSTAAVFTHEGDFLCLAFAVGYRVGSASGRRTWETLCGDGEGSRSTQRSTRRMQLARQARQEQSRYLRGRVRDLRRLKKEHGVGETPAQTQSAEPADGLDPVGAAIGRALGEGPRPTLISDHQTRGMRGAAAAASEKARALEGPVSPSAEEVADLARRVAEFEAREEARLAEADWRPSFWASEWERYAWCERSVQVGKQYLLTIEDATFLEAYRARIGTA